ncbi:hypothetical protein OPV22_004947 [Ensete ventricosum]|uniref:Wall-associated receptor kinase galacturonan-binding domain-containing protein n=1 Tax=Ensete ventricosum TaxID=4639 RepID=A0AAV8RNG7_ENSVE|nr:hypothetical protein OPV22_004947 [Ensete ventricosum]
MFPLATHLSSSRRQSAGPVHPIRLPECVLQIAELRLQSTRRRPLRCGDQSSSFGSEVIILPGYASESKCNWSAVVQSDSATRDFAYQAACHGYS